MEPLANITEYACDDEGEEWPSINCVMKRLYSDFIVTEIPADGQVLKPKQAEKPKIESKVPDDIADDDHVVEVPSEFEARSDEMRRLKKVAAGEIDLCTFDLKEFPKDVRKKLYKFIEANYGEALFTSCEDGMLKVRRSNGTTDESRKRSHWSEDRGNFLHFTLTKVNWDTQSALAMMAKKLRLRPSLFSISGTKDRRAITVQRVCAFRVEQYKLAGLRCKDIWLSDFSYSNIKLQLGDACGNRFSIILRDIDPRFGAEKLKKRLERWQCCGFLNYFGSQRFGTCGVNTAQIGRLILAAKWEEAIRALLSPRTETTDSINECLKCFAETSDASKALRLLRFHDNSANIERTLLTFLAKNPTSYKAAILGLPRDVRTMYIHAYQSAVFNRIISKRKQAFGLRVLPGDLDKNGDVINVEQDAEPVGIEQICLPLPCMEPKMPDNEVAKWYAEIAAEDELEADSYEKLERQFSLGSVYRPFVVRPANVSWELLKYSQSNEELQQCEFVPKNNSKNKVEERPKDDGKEAEEVGSKDGKAKEEQPQPFLAIRVQFDLPPGTYATIALRELMRVDFSKQSQKAMEAEILATRQPKTNVEEATEDDGKCVELEC